MTSVIDRITVNPRQCGGWPCIRGLRIRVTDVLDLLAAGLSSEQVIEELPDLEPEDVDACVRFAPHAVRNLGLKDAEDAEILAAARAADVVVMPKAPY